MIGKTVSHYTILEKIGEGGMGVVYKARDLSLDRFVALKFLPASLANDPEAKTRFVREARAASAINHPNILTIHEIDETTDGQLFIVMPVYEGESLARRLEMGALSVSEATRIAAQVASGLAKAHENGIVHRDLKPENIILTQDGRATIVDFGIAKLSTQTSLTQPGTTPGTVAYMSPEQFVGEVDHRSDIFSLGVVLYEMLAGSRPFQGDYEQVVMRNITQTESPPIARGDLPPDLGRLVERMLCKSPDDRYQSAHEVEKNLNAILQAVSGVTSMSGGPAIQSVSAAETRRRPGRVRGWIIVGVLIVAAVVVWLTARNRAERGENSAGMRSAAWTPAALTQVTFAAGVEDYPAFSPDGTMIAYNGDVGGVRQIFISNVDGSTPRRVTEGSADDIQAAWSPDGEVLWFVRSHRSDGTLEPGDVFGVHEGGDIWRHELATGRETKIVDDAFNPSFSPDGAQIAFDASWGGPRRIWIADNRGRNPRQLTFDSSEAVSQIAPRWSPDGSRIVFQNMEWTTFDIKTVDVGTGEIRWITHDGFQDLNPVWSGDGKAIYFSSAHRSGGLNVWRIDVDTEGLPVGPPHQITTGAGQDVQLAVSADGSKLAMSILRQNADIWRLPVSTDSGRPSGAPESLISTTREDSRGSWSPDGKYIAFNSDRSGDMNIWLYSLDDGTSRRITTGAGGDYQARWSPDGRSLVFFSARSGNSDIWRVDVTTGELTQLTQDPALDINPFYSPDGRYIAYQSDYDGRRELWVMQADGSQPRALTSIGVSGHFLMWSRDGKQVVFRSLSSSGSEIRQVSVSGGEPVPFAEVKGGAHMSSSPDETLVMDVIGHRMLWVSPANGGAPYAVFEFENSDDRIDYPNWSPDGKWVLFDRVKPEGGDIWVIDNLQ